MCCLSRVTAVLGLRLTIRGDSAHSALRGAWPVPLALLPLVLSLGPAPSATATTVRARSFDETVRDAGAVCVVRVLDANPRWTGSDRRLLQTEYDLRIENSLLDSSGIAKGDEITIRFWGGTRDGEIQGVAGQPSLEPGRRYVLMLRPHWSKSALSPLVGVWQGFYPVLDRYAGKPDVVVDHQGVPLFALNDRRILEYSKALLAKGDLEMVTLDGFVRLLNDDLPRIKAIPKEDGFRTETVLTPVPYARPCSPAGSASTAAARWTQPRGLPLKRVFVLDPPSAPKTSPGGGKAVACSAAALGLENVGSKQPFLGQCKLPIIVNQLPPAAAPWSPVDQECMSYWNYYVKDLFVVREQPSEAVGWGDDSFDLHGLLNDQQYKERFLDNSPSATGWDDGVLGVTHFRMKPGFGSEATPAGSSQLIEADIALNASVPWTLDDEAVCEGQQVFSYRHTLTHELGHMAGLPHHWQSLSIMNYPPAELRAFPLLTMVDAEAIRARYEVGHVPRNDLSISLFVCTTDMQWFIAECGGLGSDSRIVPGGEFGVIGYVLENLGTSTVQQPKVEWYFTRQRNWEGEKHFLGTATYPPLAPGRFFEPMSVLRQFKVPSDIAPGEYYLAAYLRDDDSPQLRGFPFDNNSAFSLKKVKVDR